MLRSAERIEKEIKEKEKKIESYLSDHYYATKALNRLRCDLIAATREYREGLILIPGHGYDATRSKNKPISDPTAKAAEILIESLGKEVDRIQRSITDNEAVIASREAFISVLDGIEKEYVRYRYFEGRSAEKVEKLMHYAHGTVVTIRRNALDKLQSRYGAICGKGDTTHDEAI